DDQPRHARGRSPARRVDGGHPRRQAVVPLGAHHRRHRRRPESPQSPMILALIAAAHVYVLPWKMLFMLPAESEKPCGVTSLRFGPPDGKWESGSNPAAADCQFHVSVQPGHLLPAWSELPPKTADAFDLTYTVQGA